MSLKTIMTSWMKLRKPTLKDKYDYQAQVKALRSEIGEDAFNEQLNNFILWGK